MKAAFTIWMVSHSLDIEFDKVNIWIIVADGVEYCIKIAHRVVGANLGENEMAADRLAFLVGTEDAAPAECWLRA